MADNGDAKTGITRIAVKGFKSLAREVAVDLAPLTILAGANNSGKSSIMQPLLLLKQTCEVDYAPENLLLSGPNVHFTSASQFLSRVETHRTEVLDIFVATEARSIRLGFKKSERFGLQTTLTEYGSPASTFTVHPGMSHVEIANIVPEEYREVYEWQSTHMGLQDDDAPPMATLEWTIEPQRCFLAPLLRYRDHAQDFLLPFHPTPLGQFSRWFTAIIYLPSARVTRYPVTAVGSQFPGNFQEYAGSVISHWQRAEPERLTMVGKDLERLGLAWQVQATEISGTEIEVKVPRLPRHAQAANENDFVSIAAVGSGLSQVLPIVVALHAASPGQLVYLEEPEIHLHPRAQRELASVLIDAIHRGVRVVAETHSSLLLLGIQTAVAEGKLDPSDVRLHWFQRDDEGVTSVRSASLDAAGAFGDWPEDFGDVDLESESRYLDAADQAKLRVH